jgi:hypothetical protein
MLRSTKLLMAMYITWAVHPGLSNGDPNDETRFAVVRKLASAKPGLQLAMLVTVKVAHGFALFSEP